MRWTALKVVCIGVVLFSVSAPAQERETTTTTVDFELRFGMVILDVAVNGTPMKFILDTGATTTGFRTKVARELKLEEIGTGEATSPGGRHTVSYVSVDSLAVGDLVQTDCLCAVADPPELGAFQDVVGLLGSDFLSRCKVTIDYREKQVTFEQYEDEGTIEGNLFVHPRLKFEVSRPDESWDFNAEPQKPGQVLTLTEKQGTGKAMVALNEVGDLSLDQVVPLAERSLRSHTDDFEMVSSVDKGYGNKDCHVIEFTGKKEGAEKRFMVVFFLVDKSLWSVGCSADPAEFAALVDEFNAIVESIRFVE